MQRIPNKKTPDFLSERSGQRAAIECKNLRAHRCVESVLPRLFDDTSLKNPAAYAFHLEVHRSFRGTLNKQEEHTVKELVSNLPRYARNSLHTVTISDRAQAIFRLKGGAGDSVWRDQISLSDLNNDPDLHRGLCCKISSTLKDAQSQLASPASQHATIKVVAMRWDVPLFGLPIPAGLGQWVQNNIEGLLSSTPRTEVLIFTDYNFSLVDTVSPLTP